MRHLLSNPISPSGAPGPVLDADARWTLLKIAEAATPAGRHLGVPDARTIESLEQLLGGMSSAALKGWSALATALDVASVPLEGAPLSRLPIEARARALSRLAASDATAWLVRAVCMPIKIVRADDVGLERALGAERPRSLPMAPERSRWAERVTDARALPADEELEVDVVVVGTGAGGAPVAARLAARGHAVVMLEEGGWFTRSDFTDRPLAMQKKLYRDSGMTLALGNALIPVPLGLTVGGTTTVNSGTCYRTPRSVLRRWQIENGLHGLSPDSLDPHFERVESMIGVAVTPPAVLGGVARVIARGCDALGWAHGPLARNAPGCDAQGVCCFGCPTDAKRSTNVSYVPRALEAGAMLFHHARVDRILRQGDRAIGVEAVSVRNDGAPPRRLVVRAKSVVLACGTFHTPALLLANGITGRSGRVGHGLTIHPCGYAWARFAEPIRGWAEVPQGYAVDELVEHGIRFEGAFAPIAISAGAFSAVGEEWTSAVEDFERIATFGFMIADTSRGRVTLGEGGAPRVRYRLNDADVRTMVRAQAALARIYFAAGAERVHPGMALHQDLRDLGDVERLEREGPEQVRARHLDLSAYHPLGTCQMGADPSRFVVSPEHEVHELSGLFVCDGSAIPGPLGVNPQVTIMAMSERAVDHVERRIVGRPRAVARPARRELAFDETMAGTCEATESGSRFRTSFTVSVRGAPSMDRVTSWELEGTIRLFGITGERPCRGTLEMRPTAPSSNLIYELTFCDDAGRPCTLRGVKHAPYFRVTGMTTLHTEIRREGELLARGVLRFDLRDVPRWLATFRLALAPATRAPAAGDAHPTARAPEPARARAPEPEVQRPA